MSSQSRSPKLVKEFDDIIKRFPTLGEVRTAKPKGYERLTKGNESQSDAYPTSRAVEDYLMRFD